MPFIESGIKAIPHLYKVKQLKDQIWFQFRLSLCL